MRTTYVVKPTLVVVADDEHAAAAAVELRLTKVLNQWFTSDRFAEHESGEVAFPTGALLYWNVNEVEKVGA